MLVSAIVVTHNEGDLLRRTLSGLWASLPVGGEIVVVDDGSSDGSTAFRSSDRERLRIIRTSGLGVARARNLGARHARGGILAFFDSHVDVGRSFWAPVIELLAEPGVGAVAPAISMLDEPDARLGYGLTFTGPDLSVRWLQRQAGSPYAVPILPGCALAIRRSAFDAVGGFDDGLIRWGSIDNEFSLRLWLFGYELLVIPEIEVAHLFRSKHPYRVEWAWVIHNAMRLAVLHLTEHRVRKVIGALSEKPSAFAALDLLEHGDVYSRRRMYAESRLFNDDLYFDAIGLAFD